MDSIDLEVRKKEKIRQQLVTLFWAKSHMEEAIEACRLMAKLETEGVLTPRLTHCLFTGILCTYARSFGQNEGMSGLAPELRIFDDPDLQKHHARILDVRNRMYAHRDVNWEAADFSEENDSADPMRIMIKIDDDGSTEWEVTRHATGLSSVLLIMSMCEIHKRRFEVASSKKLIDYMDRGSYEPGVYDLSEL